MTSDGTVSARQATGPVVGVGGVARDTSGRVLLVRRGNPPARGRWTLPGGKIERGERARAAVEREFLEETGLVVEAGDLVGFAESIGEHGHYVILDFHVRVVGGDLAAGDDAEEVRWMRRAEIEHVGATPGLLDFLDAHTVDIAP